MLLLAVVTEPLAMIRQQNDGGAVVELVRLQILHQPPDDLVAVCDFRIVRGVHRKALGCSVGLVRLVQVQEEKGAGRVDALEPVLGSLL